MVESFDYLFITWGNPLSESDGAVNKQIRYIANALSAKFNVGVLYLPYSLVARRFKMNINDNFNKRIKTLAGYYLYSSIVRSGIINKSENENLFDKKVTIFYLKFPKIKIKRAVTSYWWAVILANEFYKDVPIYFILYHDYSVDIKNSNINNLEFLNQAYKISNKISANPVLEQRLNYKMPIIREGIELNKYKSGVKFEQKEKSILLPLRNGSSKGAEYGISAMEMLHKEFQDIKINAFGYYNGKIPDYINFYYKISDENLKILYGKSMFFVLPSIEEGISEPLIEAMINGCIPISTKCGGPESVIVQNENGFLVPVKDPEAIFKTLASIINRDLFAVSENAVKTAKKYDINITSSDFLNSIKYYED